MAIHNNQFDSLSTLDDIALQIIMMQKFISKVLVKCIISNSQYWLLTIDFLFCIRVVTLALRLVNNTHSKIRKLATYKHFKFTMEFEIRINRIVKQSIWSLRRQIMNLRLFVCFWIGKKIEYIKFFINNINLSLCILYSLKTESIFVEKWTALIWIFFALAFQLIRTRFFLQWCSLTFQYIFFFSFQKKPLKTHKRTNKNINTSQKYCTEISLTSLYVH